MRMPEDTDDFSIDDAHRELTRVYRIEGTDVRWRVNGTTEGMLMIVSVGDGGHVELSYGEFAQMRAAGILTKVQ